MKLHFAITAILELASAQAPLRKTFGTNQIGIHDQYASHSPHSKVVHLVRHGQAFNNLGHYDWLDPNLTDKGLGQARDLGKHWTESDSIDLVVSSPQLRALNTTFNALDVMSKRKLALPDFSRNPIIALPELQELGASPSSRGHLRKDLEDMIGHPPLFPVNMELLTPEWNSTEGYWDRNETASVARAKITKQWLFDRDERNIMVVGHDANLKLLVNNTCFRDHIHRCQGWNNAQARHFRLERAEGEIYFIEDVILPFGLLNW